MKRKEQIKKRWRDKKSESKIEKERDNVCVYFRER